VVFQARSRPAHRLGDSLDCLLLTDDVFPQLVFHVQQPQRFFLCDLHHRNAGPHDTTSAISSADTTCLLGPTGAQPFKLAFQSPGAPSGLGIVVSVIFYSQRVVLRISRNWLSDPWLSWLTGSCTCARRGRLIDQIDGFIWQKTLCDIACRQCTAASSASSEIVRRWCSSYAVRMPAGSRLFHPPMSSTITGWKRRSSAASLSICLRTHPEWWLRSLAAHHATKQVSGYWLHHNDRLPCTHSM